MIFRKGPPPPPRKADDDSCRELLDQIAKGSESALAEFYRIFEARVYAFAPIRLNDFHETADPSCLPIHLVFVVASRGEWEKFGEPEPFTIWEG
ncbi:MAG: hypothetical protein VST66_07585 [Nitrospirota bacterium]|nr:hypothetical protein [Nitrospirota bacterium]